MGAHRLIPQEKRDELKAKAQAKADLKTEIDNANSVPQIRAALKKLAKVVLGQDL
jgi:hypothetical protein